MQLLCSQTVRSPGLAPYRKILIVILLPAAQMAQQIKRLKGTRMLHTRRKPAIGILQPVCSFRIVRDR